MASEKINQVNYQSKQYKEAVDYVTNKCAEACEKGAPYFLLNLSTIPFGVKVLLLKQIAFNFPLAYYRAHRYCPDDGTDIVVSGLQYIYDGDINKKGYYLEKIPGEKEWDVQKYDHLVIVISNHFKATNFIWPATLPDVEYP